MLYNGLATAVNPMLMKLHDLDIPVIAAVNGAAAGAGAPLALSADFVIAGSSAFFYFAFPNVGLALDAGASWLMPRLVGLARASEALMLAERIPAAKAADWGMIYKAVADDELADRNPARWRSGWRRDRPAVVRADPPCAPRRAQREPIRQRFAQPKPGRRPAPAIRSDCAEAVAAFLEKRASGQFAGQ